MGQCKIGVEARGNAQPSGEENARNRNLNRIFDGFTGKPVESGQNKSVLQRFCCFFFYDQKISHWSTKFNDAQKTHQNNILYSAVG
jgi:hypothetical protein